MKSLKRKLFNLLFVWVISKTPEKCMKLRNWCVINYVEKSSRSISIGQRCIIHRNTSIGNNSGVGRECEISNGVTIGDDVMMGPNVLIYTQNHCTSDPNTPMRTQGMTAIQPVFIEDDVWVGARVCILPGVTIGKGSVIGAYAVVSKSVPPYSIVVGNPARIVKSRMNIVTEHKLD